jgi:hypothetical protein
LAPVVTAEHELSDFLSVRRESLIKAATGFTSCLNALHGDVGDHFLAIVYFDEAHTLQNVDTKLYPEGHTPYLALMHVLRELRDIPIFFIFLSTDSRLSSLPPNDMDYPSLRLRSGWKLIPSFFELPFDAFCQGFTTEVKERGKLTLDGVCELQQMVKFGRPM